MRIDIFNFDMVTADENGRLWVFIGTDSGFEGKTMLYFNNVQVLLEARRSRGLGKAGQ